jgi:hypothetical protein
MRPSTLLFVAAELGLKPRVRLLRRSAFFWIRSRGFVVGCGPVMEDPMLSAACSLPSRRIDRRITSALHIVAVALCLLATALPRVAGALPVTGLMTGAWTVVDDAGGVLGGAVLPGTAFSATLVYDDATPDSNALPEFGNYFGAPAQFSFTLSTGGFLFSHVAAGVNEIDVIDLGSGDGVAVYAETFTVSPALPPLGLTYTNPSFGDPSGTALSSDALTGVPWSLGAWSSPGMAFFADIDDGNPLTYFDLQGDVTGLTVVPQPTTRGLLSLGLALLGCGARRRR